MEDLWSQVYLLDTGKRLGKTQTEFRGKYFKKNEYTPFAKYDLRTEKDDLVGKDYYQKKIFDKISDICVSMQAKDWLDLPERIDITREVCLPSHILAQYEAFEREAVLRYAEEENGEISAPNAAALIGKLLQFSNGAVYTGEGKNYYEVHNEKIAMLGELLEAANGNPMLVTYQFQSDVERIQKHLKAFKPVHIKDSADILKRWNDKKIPVLLGHAASMGHGLNMQNGGRLITHFGIGWPVELYQQVVARLHRQGQLESVINTRLICPQTYEINVLHRTEAKAEDQETLMQAVKALIKKHEQ
jgi:SNF2 family DNA or RNA helicase